MLDFEIDKLTNSIENVRTGEVFDTVITKVDATNSKTIKKKEWLFNWHKEMTIQGRSVYKLSTVNNPTIIQGLICIEDNNDHIFMHLVENAKFNIGLNKIYYGVAGNLVAFACNIALKKAMMVFLPLMPKLNSLNITLKHLEQHILEGNGCLYRPKQQNF
jgi:hypothetical protein